MSYTTATASVIERPKDFSPMKLKDYNETLEIEKYLSHFDDFLVGYSAYTSGLTIEEAKATGVI